MDEAERAAQKAKELFAKQTSFATHNYRKIVKLLQPYVEQYKKQRDYEALYIFGECSARLEDYPHTSPEAYRALGEAAFGGIMEAQVRVARKNFFTAVRGIPLTREKAKYTTDKDHVTYWRIALKEAKEYYDKAFAQGWDDPEDRAYYEELLKAIEADKAEHPEHYTRDLNKIMEIARQRAAEHRQLVKTLSAEGDSAYERREYDAAAEKFFQIDDLAKSEQALKDCNPYYGHALCMIGRMLHEGHLHRPELFEYGFFYGAADRYKDAYAMGMVGDYKQTQDANLPVAIRWYAEGARLGDPRCQMFYAVALMKGLTREHDDEPLYPHVARLLTGAAKAGEPRAIYLLGCLYELGKGVPEDAKLAQQLFDVAAKAGWTEEVNKEYERVAEENRASIRYNEIASLSAPSPLKAEGTAYSTWCI